MEEARLSNAKNSSRPSSPLSPRTRRAADASLKRLRSGTTLQDADDRFAIRRNSFPAEAAKRQANTGKGRAAVQKTIKQSPHDQRPASSGSRTSLHKQKPSSSSGAVASDQDIRDLLQPADPNVTFELGTGSENHHQDLAGQMTSQDVLMGEQSAPEPQLSCATNGAIVDVSLYDSEMADLTESARKDPSEPLTNPEDAAPLLGAPLLGAFQDGQPRPDRLRSSSPDAMGTAMGVTGPGNSDDAKGSAERWEAEEAILAQAKRIRRSRDTRNLVAYPEPKKPKTHWDFLLEEMQWMSKEFARERKWKLAQAKKFVRKAATCENNLALRDTVRQRDEASKIRKRASWIGKEVMKFWAKAERVVNYKNKSVADARKKEVMDKHLTYLVEQTQRYSSLLAERLQTGADATEAELKTKQELLESVKAAESQAGQGSELQQAIAKAANAAAAGRESLAIAEAAGPSQGGSEHAAQPMDERASEGEDADLDDAEDFAAEESEVDDEATLEEEEELAREEIDNTANEIQDLADEADLPLEELMARYGYTASADTVTKADPEIKAEGPSLKASEAEVTQATEEAVTVEPEDEQMDMATLNEGKPDNNVEEQDQMLSAGQIEKQPEVHADAVDTEMAEFGDQDYQAEDMEDIDDEATIDQEEMLAATEGVDGKEAEGAELAALNVEAELPLEDLLAMYKGARNNLDADFSSDAESEELQAHGLMNGKGSSEDHEWAHILAGNTDNIIQETQQPSQKPKFLQKQPDIKEAPAPNTEIGVKTEKPVIHRTDLEGAAKQENSVKAGAPDPEDIVMQDQEPTKDKLEDAAALAAEAQPTGTTFETTNVHTKAPFLLKHTMREYQHIGLDWLMTIYTRRLNGILADEMGLGKTIQTIALLAHLACEKGIWGPHLIVVPTSVMLNWEMECKKWCPAFKLLTYYGSAKERKLKRQGWSKSNAFHVCITSYTLVLQDAKMFRRKKWKYLILDEAHMIKNWKSQRWQTLLNFNSARRLLITGTPLQNDLMELWSLMHFLMPQVFASHAQFKDWFSNPLTNMVDGSELVNKGLVDRLHSVLRPFLLRRLKSEVEKQMPGKHEHVIRCRLSKRQRTLYEDYMASSDTRSTLSSGNFLGIINVLMSLRKVCNHPDLFEGRPIVSAFDFGGIEVQMPSLALNAKEREVWCKLDFRSLRLLPCRYESMSQWEAATVKELATSNKQLIEEVPNPAAPKSQSGDPFSGVSLQESLRFRASSISLSMVEQFKKAHQHKHKQDALAKAVSNTKLNHQRCSEGPLIGADIARSVIASRPADIVCTLASKPSCFLDFSNSLRDIVRLPEERAEELEELKTFIFAIPKARAPPPKIWCSRPDTSVFEDLKEKSTTLLSGFQARSQLLQTATIRQQMFFPDRRLVQFDCGKLQELAKLLHRLKLGGHKALIFTQMTKMLDVLEAFLNLHSYTYLRLDGSTKPEQRQILMQRFNSNPKIFIFILSTRSGGVGMNLTGADTVIFYDSDWNPAMDAQAQDRCHRIGQTREVHIYRLVSENTIEENILAKSDQKRHLDHLAIQTGGFNTEFLQKFNPKDLLELQGGAGVSGGKMTAEDLRAAMRSAEDETDAAAAAAAELETAEELAEFTAEPVPAAENDDNDAAPKDDSPGEKLVEEVEKPVTPQEETELDIGTEGMATLEASLRPVEMYAVRWVKQNMENQVDVEAETAKVEQELGAQEWNMQEIERQQRMQEEDAEEEGEAQRMAEWDRKAADEAYKTEIERAKRQQEILDEQAAAWAKKEAERLAILLQAASRPAVTKRSRSVLSDDFEDSDDAPDGGFEWQPAVSRRGRNIRTARHKYADDIELSSDEDWAANGAAKRPKRASRQLSLAENTNGVYPPHNKADSTTIGKMPNSRASSQVWTPWEQAEDLVLCAVVEWSFTAVAAAGLHQPQLLAGHLPNGSAQPAVNPEQAVDALHPKAATSPLAPHHSSARPPIPPSPLQFLSTTQSHAVGQPQVQTVASSASASPTVAAARRHTFALPNGVVAGRPISGPVLGIPPSASMASTSHMRPPLYPNGSLLPGPSGNPSRQTDGSISTQGNDQVELAAAVWERASNALAAGASALTPSAAAAAFQQGRRRSPKACRVRYELLCKAGQGAVDNSEVDPLGLHLLRAQLSGLIRRYSKLTTEDLKQLIKAAAGKLKDDQSQDRLSPAAAEGVIEDFNRLIAEQSMQDPQLETNDGGQPRTTALEARNLLDVVKRACGPASKDVLQLLQPLLAKLGNNSVQEVNKDHIKQLQVLTQNNAQASTVSLASLPRANLRPIPGVGRHPTPRPAKPSPREQGSKKQSNTGKTQVNAKTTQPYSMHSTQSLPPPANWASISNAMASYTGRPPPSRSDMTPAWGPSNTALTALHPQTFQQGNSMQQQVGPGTQKFAAPQQSSSLPIFNPTNFLGVPMQQPSSRPAVRPPRGFVRSHLATPVASLLPSGGPSLPGQHQQAGSQAQQGSYQMLSGFLPQFNPFPMQQMPAGMWMPQQGQIYGMPDSQPGASPFSGLPQSSGAPASNPATVVHTDAAGQSYPAASLPGLSQPATPATSAALYQWMQSQLALQAASLQPFAVPANASTGLSSPWQPIAEQSTSLPSSNSGVEGPSLPMQVSQPGAPQIQENPQMSTMSQPSPLGPGDLTQQVPPHAFSQPQNPTSANQQG